MMMKEEEEEEEEEEEREKKRKKEKKKSNGFQNRYMRDTGDGGPRRMRSMRHLTG